MRWGSPAALAAVIVIAAGCSGTGSAASSVTGGPPASAFASVPAVPAPAGSRRVPTSCPVTVPTATFVPPLPYPPEPPAAYRARWYGTNALWTLLDPAGEVWSDLPYDGSTFGQKTVWWSAAWDAPHEWQPIIAVRGRQLDGDATFEAGNPGTNATADFGTAMLVGVDVPGPGCWEIQATYRGASLAYVFWLPGR